MKRKYKSGSEKRKDEKRKAKNVESDAEGNPPAPTPFVADEAQSSTSNQDAASVSFEFEENVDNFNDDQLGLFDLSNEFPTDKGHFPSSIEDGDLKRLIFNHGPYRPDGPFTVEDAEGNITKNFCLSYYQLHTKNKTCPRSWLCYSQILRKPYCENCWLFADRNNQRFAVQSAWVKLVASY